MKDFPRSFSSATRKENLARLQETVFDLLVVGGGITGTSVARDASLRGLSTALVEKGDWGSGTSSRSSRLIHGGLRYLENYQVGLVFRCCRERRTMRRIAPRLVRPLPFLYPIYRGQKPPPWKLRIGLTLYDGLSLFRNIQRHVWLSPREVAQREPILGGRGLLGAARFYDAQVDDARLTLFTARAAHLAGAVVANYVEAVAPIEEGGVIRGAMLLDRIGGARFPVRARVVVNVTGVWVDSVRRWESRYRGAIVRPTKGIHLVISRQRLPTHHAVVLDSPRDGRHIFLIPWNRFALVGTTDTDYDGDLDHPSATRDDVEYLLEALAHIFPGARVGADDVVSTFAGLRPLLYAEGGTYALSREHRILASPSGMITVAGGKLTTARMMAEQIVDRVEQRLRELGVQAAHPCRTKEPLPGTERARVPADVDDREVHAHLVEAYGPDAAWVLAYAEENPSLGERILPPLPYLMAEPLYAVHHEMAMTLSDVLIRRTRILHQSRDGGLGRARAVAEVMAPHLGWTESEIENQVREYGRRVQDAHAWEEESG